MATSDSSSEPPIIQPEGNNTGTRPSNSRSSTLNSPVIQSDPSSPAPMVFLTLPIHTKLSRNNFLAWKSQIEPLLHAYGLGDFLVSPHPPPVSTASSSGVMQQNPSYLAWYKQDQMILAWIRASLSEQVLAQVVSCATSGDLWHHLSQSFSATSRARLTDLKKQLQNATKGSTSCSDFIHKIRSISDELAFVGAPIPDQDLVLTVLGGLGSEYNSFVVAINTRLEPVTFLEVQSLLLSHECLLQAQHSSVSSLPSSTNPTAFYAHNPQQNFRPPSNNNRNPRNFKSRGGGFRPPSQNMRPRNPSSQPLLPTPSVANTGNRNSNDVNSSSVETCQICFKRGHNARICWWRCDMRYSDDIPPPQQSQPPSMPPQAHVAHTVASTSTPTEWYLDSGATHHITSDINNLSSFVPYDGMDRLQIGDGNGMSISHIGSFTIHVGTVSIILNDVLLVPHFTKNLLSLSRLLADNAFTVEFSNSGCVIKDYHTSVPLMQAKATNGLYLLTVCYNCAPQALLGERVNAHIWHCRLGHPAAAITRTILSNCNLPSNNNTLNFCEDCAVAKCHRLPFVPSTSKSVAPLELLHSDVWGPAPVLTDSGFRYFLVFVDDFTRFTWIFFLKSKDEVVKVFSSFKLQVENLLGTNIKVLRTDGGTEFKPITRLFPQLVHQTTCPHTPEQNGVAERKHRHILELSLAVINHGCIPLTLWDEIFASVVYLINRLPPSHHVSQTSPFERLFLKKPDYLHLKVLGSQCFPFLRPYNHHKLQSHSVPHVFIGYAMSQKGYRCYHPQTRRIIVSRHVLFNEQVFPFKHNTSSCETQPVDYSLWTPVSNPHGPSSTAHITSHCDPTGLSNLRPADSIHNDLLLSPLLNSGTSDRSSQRSNTLNNSDRVSVPEIPSTTHPSSTDISHPGHPTTSTHPMVTRSRDHTRRSRQFPDFVAYLATASPNSDPTTFAQASKISHWRDAMSSEIAALHSNQTWQLVPPPMNQNVVGCKWIYKTKRHSDGTVARYKARLVAKGFTQEEGVDYFDTFSPVVRPTTIRIVLALAVTNRWPLRQLDVNNAFLNGVLHETVYMQQPPGFVDVNHPSHVCLLHKSIYGLKQSPRAWFHTLSTTLMELGFHGSKFDPSLFISHTAGQITVVLIYVDDIIVTGSDMTQVASLITTLQSHYPLKDLGILSFFLGISVKHTPDGLHLSQKQYVTDLLHRTYMSQAQSVSSPMAVNTSLSKFDGDPFHDPKLYRAVVGALQYVTITRPEITFPVNKCSQFMHSPTTAHWSAVKRILRYLNGTLDHGLRFTSSSSLTLHAYSDSDWAGCPDDRRSTSAFCIYLGSNLISWSSKKQPTVSKSSTEAEYRSLALAGAELIWIQYILQELHQRLTQPPVLWCDNIGATYLASNPMYHARTKHVEIDFHFIRERVVAKQLLVHFLCSKDQIADGLTKGLTTARFLSIRNKLMVCPVPLT
ncbi:polyprotein [Rhynchospora pubera]|uniref:Polyprotein n=1 Tax=Rhynchospora pubera TaxID=906938 RepID=A0AAV8CSJ0_9POAL|nr:polyprotein [Rhynchospora pubera]